MIIKYKDKKFIFIHVQKCGGTSVIDYFKVPKKHNKIKHDIKLIKSKKENLKKYFKFTVIRNPWDRMVSFFHYHKEKILDKNFPTKTWSYIKDLNFTQFLRSDKFQKWAAINNITDFITFKDKIYIDYFINFDNLNNDFKLIQKICKNNSDLKFKNKSNHKSYEKYYKNKKNIEIINFLFKKEIEFFNFKFGKKVNLKKLNKKILN